MKYFKKYLSVILLGALVCNASAQYREFTSTDGKTILGKVVTYNEHSERVTIERENGRKATVPITAFSEEDQAYILEWHTSQSFLSDFGFKIVCEKECTDRRTEEEWGDVYYTDGAVEKELLKKSRFESYVFKVNLNNRGSEALSNLRMEYIIYYEQSKTDWNEAVVKQEYLKDKEDIPDLDPRETRTVTTKSVEIYNDTLGSNDNWVSGRMKVAGEGEVHGIRVRIYMKTGSGGEILREVTYPEDLDADLYFWKK